MLRTSILWCLTFVLSNVVISQQANAQLFQRWRQRRQAALQSRLQPPNQQPPTQQQQPGQQQQPVDQQPAVTPPPEPIGLFPLLGFQRGLFGRRFDAPSTNQPDEPKSKDAAGSDRSRDSNRKPSTDAPDSSSGADNARRKTGDPPLTPGEGSPAGENVVPPDPGNPYGGSILNQPDVSFRIQSDELAGVAPSATMGVQVDAPPGIRKGVRIAVITPNSLVEQSGLRVGDIILGVNGHPVSRPEDFGVLLSVHRPGDVIPVTYVRQGTAFVTRVPLIARENHWEEFYQSSDPQVAAAKEPVVADVSAMDTNLPEQSDPRIELGMLIQDPGSQRGTVVTKVDSKSIAQAAGIKPGDRIVSIDGRVLESGVQLRQHLSSLDWGDSLAVGVVRGDTLISRRIDLAQPELDTLTLNSPNGADFAGDDASSPAQSSGTAASIGRGLGSIFGGLFGSSQPETSGDENTSAAPSKDLPSPTTIEDLPAPEPQAIPRVDRQQAVSPNVDPMEFGDGESAKSSIFP